MVEVIVRPIEALYFTAPAATAEFLSVSGILRKMLHVVLANTSSSNFSIHFPVADTFRRDIIPVTFLSTICRTLMVNFAAVTAQFSSMLNDAGISSSEGAVFQAFIRYMLDKFDSVSYRNGGKWHQKLWCLTMSAFFPSQDPTMVSYLPEIIHCATSVLVDDKSDHWEMMLSAAEGRDPDGEDPIFRIADAADAAAAPGPETIVTSFRELMKADVVSNTDMSALISRLLEGMKPYLNATDMATLVHQAGLQLYRPV